jgi:uncharacterized protein
MSQNVIPLWGGTSTPCIDSHELLVWAYQRGRNKKVKVDILRTEQLEYAPDLQNVIIGYSDIEEHKLLCYQLEEVFIEKMRAVLQRIQARDFYKI